MRVTRVRAFKKKGETEITIRVNGEEAESIAHALCILGPDYVLKIAEDNRVYPRLVAKGFMRLHQLLWESMWQAWSVRPPLSSKEYERDVNPATRQDLSDIYEWKL